ncbi:DUF2887 domain-containing protein [Anaerolineales bacterium HSG6]|nr:DUF2887 domain-containing protein [Anaerolineales bacterium HSG6]
MKTDSIFYELFQTEPSIFFELMHITPACQYRFKSITIKTTEKRIDGVFEPEIETETIYFVEVQAQPDKTMYWRTMREVATYFEQRPDLKNDWRAIVLWLDENDDHKFGNASHLRLKSVYLSDLLKKLPESSLPLNTLRPFMVDYEQEVRQNINSWVEHIRQVGLKPEFENRLVDILTRLIEQKFKTLSYEELEKMLKLTPYRETQSFQKALHEELFEDRLEFLSDQIEVKFKFAQRTMNKLILRLKGLALDDLKLFSIAMFDMNRLYEINAWIDERLAKPAHNDNSTNGGSEDSPDIQNSDDGEGEEIGEVEAREQD